MVINNEVRAITYRLFGDWQARFIEPDPDAVLDFIASNVSER
jgi:hypothetical protein